MRRLDSWINRSGPLRYATKCRRQNPQHTKLNCPCMSAACIARAVGPMGTSTSIGAQQGRRTWSVLARGMTVTIIPVLE